MYCPSCRMAVCIWLTDQNGRWSGNNRGCVINLEKRLEQLRCAAPWSSCARRTRRTRRPLVSNILSNPRRAPSSKQCDFIRKSAVPPMNKAERIAIDMIRRHGTRETAIQQAHVCDVEAMTDKERAFRRALLVELRRCGFPKAAE